MLNVQRLAKTVPFTNAVYPLVLRSKRVVEMVSPLPPPLAVETLCKEQVCLFCFVPCVCGLCIIFLVEEKIRAMGGPGP